MKKIIFLLALWLGVPSMLLAQNVYDDLYYMPSKKEAKEQRVVKEKYTRNNDMSAHDRINGRSVDEYNRRGVSRPNTGSADSDLDGEWVNGFEGSRDDYEYATRLIRFHNPRFAVSVSSPYYWDVVYGLNSWDWNIYTDGFYAYAFPRFPNRLWWDWRYNSYGWGGYGWNGYAYWGMPRYSFGWSSWGGPYWSVAWGGWYDPWYSPYYWGGYGFAGYGYPTYYGYSRPVNYNNRRDEGYYYSRGNYTYDSGVRRGGYYTDGTRRYDRRGRSGGRVVNGNSSYSNRDYYDTRRGGGYTRSNRVNNSYSNPNSDYRNSGSYQRMNGNSNQRTYRTYTPSQSTTRSNNTYSAPVRSNNSGSGNYPNNGGARRR